MLSIFDAFEGAHSERAKLLIYYKASKVLIFSHIPLMSTFDRVPAHLAGGGDPDIEDAFLFVKAKCNLAPRDLPALRYTIANARQVGFDKKLNKPIEAPFIVSGPIRQRFGIRGKYKSRCERRRADSWHRREQAIAVDECII
jgi:hypothetical protein